LVHNPINSPVKLLGHCTVAISAGGLTPSRRPFTVVRVFSDNENAIKKNFLGGPGRLAAGSNSQPILNGIAAEVNLKLMLSRRFSAKKLHRRKILQLLRSLDPQASGRAGDRVERGLALILRIRLDWNWRSCWGWDRFCRV
jgi:hypothetical protein